MTKVVSYKLANKNKTNKQTNKPNMRAYIILGFK